MIHKYISKLLNKLLNKKDLYFIGSSDILPPPLDKDVETELVKKTQMGDMNARNILIEHNLRLVVFLAKKYDNSLYDLEDLVSIGSIGLIKGIESYKIDKNIKLATYCSRCIDNEILMFLRKNKRKSSEVSFEDVVNFDSEGNELKFEDIFGTEEDIVHNEVETKQNKSILLNELTKLNDRDKEIISLRYGLNNNDELTQKEVADKLSISQSYISRIEKKVINKLKNVIKV